MKRFLVMSAVTLALVGASAGAAGAAEPANQACVGESLSALASNQTAPGAFGAGVVGLAQNLGAPGLGDNIQVFQTGVVPDEFIPNTCNDAP